MILNSRRKAKRSHTAEGHHWLLFALHAPLQNTQRIARWKGPAWVLKTQNILVCVKLFVNIWMRLEVEHYVWTWFNLYEGKTHATLNLKKQQKWQVKKTKQHYKYIANSYPDQEKKLHTNQPFFFIFEHHFHRLILMFWNIFFLFS